MNDFFVYEHWRPDKNECFYIGKGRGRRSELTVPRNSLHRAIRARLATSGFAAESRIIKDGLTASEAFDLEKTLIAKYGRADRLSGSLANLTDGGGAGPYGRKRGCPSDEVRRRMSLAQMGKRHSRETRAKISARLVGNSYHLGKPNSAETRAKLSAAHKGRTPHNKGKHHTADHKAKLSAALIGRSKPIGHGSKISMALSGRRFSLEHRANLSRACKGRILSPEHRAKIAVAMRGNHYRVEFLRRRRCQ